MLTPTFNIKSFGVVNKGDCNDLLQKLQKHPISVGINASQLSLYRNGVFDGCNSDRPINHAVLLVAFIAGKGWKIKNSWGTSWGQ